MTQKINGKKKLLFHCFIVSLFLVLVYSRFVGLNWGLPYPMHPDERNMANALQQLQCKFPIHQLADCFNPHFFAYGQFPLYLGYLLIWILKGFRSFGSLIINFEEAVMSLRVISAIASIINVFVLVKIINLIFKKNKTLLVVLILTFSPFFIQFSHFGTTESLLMLFYSLIVYLSMQLLERRTTTYAVAWLALVSGLALATKVSSLIFLAVPVVAILESSLQKRSHLSTTLVRFLTLLGIFVGGTVLFFIIFSPYNFIYWKDFLSSMSYESDVALGRYVVFYTRQFVDSVPVLFQFKNIFPYVLGWPSLILGGLGFMGGLGWKDRKINLLRFAILIYLIPSAFLYAKWARFMSPVFPLMLVLAILFLLKIRIKVITIIIVIIAILPGIAYLSVYQNPDVRFQASKWIYKNIPDNSYILSETANVVDIPVELESYKVHKVYKVISFNFYDLDESPELQLELREHLEKADYIFIPSRRIFANHPRYKYPLLNDYYDKLFSGKLGFKKVAEFSAGLNDESAEETWTVFDHPVIRIYKKI